MQKVVDVFKKLAKLPSFIWVLCVLATSFFANSYSLFNVLTPEVLGDYVAQTVPEGMSVQYDAQLLWIFVCVGVPFATWGIFELIIRLVYRNMFFRRSINNNTVFYNQTLRIAYSVTNLLIGLFSLLYYAVPQMATFGELLFNIVAFFCVFTLAYWILSWSVISPAAVASAYGRLYKLFVLIFGILSLFDAVVALVSNDVGVAEKIAYSLRFALVAGYALVGQFVIYKKFKKREDSYVAPAPKEDVNTPPTPPDEVFKGFGF